MLNVRMYDMLLVHVIASHGVHTYFPDSQLQAVIMEVLSVGGGVVGEGGVREQIITTIPTLQRIIIISNTSRTRAIRIGVTVKLQYSCLVFIVFSPIEEFNNYITYKWPTQIIVMLSTHNPRPDSYMSIFGTSIAICINAQKHFIPTGVCVEWWTDIFIVELLAPGELCECELTH